MREYILFAALWALFGLIGWYLWDYELKEAQLRVKRRDRILLKLFFIVTGLAGFMLALLRDATDFIEKE